MQWSILFFGVGSALAIVVICAAAYACIAYKAPRGFLDLSLGLFTLFLAGLVGEIISGSLVGTLTQAVFAVATGYYWACALADFRRLQHALGRGQEI